MAFDAQRQIRENTLELQEFLQDLKQWENRVKEKDKSLKIQAQQEVLEVPPIRGRVPATTAENTQLRKDGQGSTPAVKPMKSKKGASAGTAARHTYNHFRDKWDKFDVDAALKEVDEEEACQSKNCQQAKPKKAQDQPNDAQFVSLPQTAQRLGGGVGTFGNVLTSSNSSDSFVDAASEKELGNQYFKEKKYVQAIDHYSQSIALQPSAVAYANRGMAYIKLRRFKEAEMDCTEAITLDDRYVKAHSRRGTARKELENLLGAVEDAEFALRLEPENKELKKQYVEAKSLLEKVAGVKDELKVPLPIEEVRPEENKSMDKNMQNLLDKDCCDSGSGNGLGHLKESKQPVNGEAPSKRIAVEQPLKYNGSAMASIQATAARAAAVRACMPIVAPRTFYEFETMWKSFSGNPSQQAELLKAMNPLSMPSLFKDNLSPRLLLEILRLLKHLFPEHANHAIEILENLINVKRFNMTIMCLTSKEKADLRELWEQCFLGCDLASDKIEMLKRIQAKYQL